MRNPQEYTERKFAQLPSQEALVGTFVSQAGPTATVDTGGRRLEAKASTMVPVLPGDPVRLERRGSELVMIGPTVARDVLGRVTVAGNPATVEYPNGSGVTAVLPVAVGVSVDVDDIVFLDWGSNGLVVAVVESPEPPAPPAPPEPPTRKKYTQTFTAIDSGSYGGGSWWNRDVWASTNNTGAWFYGSKIRDTIPNDADILSAKIYLPAIQNLYGAPLLGRHSNSTKPGGNVSVTNTISLSPDQGWVSIPTSWLAHLKSNSGGIGITAGASYNIYRGEHLDGQSGAITVTYRA